MSLAGIPINENTCIGDSLDTINNAFQTLDARTGMPIGSLIYYPKNRAIPFGFLECNGSDTPILSYNDLYSVLTLDGTEIPFGQPTAGNAYFKIPNLSTTGTSLSGFNILIKY